MQQEPTPESQVGGNCGCNHMTHCVNVCDVLMSCAAYWGPGGGGELL